MVDESGAQLGKGPTKAKIALSETEEDNAVLKTLQIAGSPGKRPHASPH